MLWGVLSTDGADKVWTVVGKMTFLSAAEAGRVTHVFRAVEGSVLGMETSGR